jgi:hypothetical protein
LTSGAIAGRLTRLLDADQVTRGIADGAVANPYGCSVGSWTTSAPLAFEAAAMTL